MKKRSKTLVLLFLAFFIVSCQQSANNAVEGYVEGEFVYISSALPGTLKMLSVSRGQEVQPGQQLFVLDDTSERAMLAKERSALELAERELTRQKSMIHTRGATTAEQLDRAQFERDQHVQLVNNAQWQVDQKRSTAPNSGVIFDTLYREGEWVPAGHPIVALLPPSNIKVRTFIPETKLSKVKLGDLARVHVDSLSETLAGKISFISPRAEFTPPVVYSRASREKFVFMVEVSFDSNNASKLHPGLPVDVQLGF